MGVDENLLPETLVKVLDGLSERLWLDAHGEFADARFTLHGVAAVGNVERSLAAHGSQMPSCTVIS